MSIKLTGDGCRYCNPQYYIEILHETIQAHETETTQLKERIAELEAKAKHDDELLNKYSIQITELQERELDLATITYLQGAGKTDRLKRFARKIYDELQELKSGVVAEFSGTVGFNGDRDLMWVDDETEKTDYCLASYDENALEQGMCITVTIKEKKQ